MPHITNEHIRALISISKDDRPYVHARILNDLLDDELIDIVQDEGEIIATTTTKGDDVIRSARGIPAPPTPRMN